MILNALKWETGPAGYLQVGSQLTETSLKCWFLLTQINGGFGHLVAFGHHVSTRCVIHRVSNCTSCVLV